MQLESGSPLSHEQARLLNEVTHRLGEELACDAALHAVLRSLVPQFADVLALVLADGAQGDSVHVAHGSPEREPVVRRALEAVLDSARRVAREESASGRVFRWVPRLTPATLRRLTRGDPGLAGLLESLRLTSLLVVPLRVGGRILGVFAAGRTAGGHAFAAADLTLAQIIARRLAVAIESARLRATMQATEEGGSRLQDALNKWSRVFEAAEWGAAVVDGMDQRIEAANPALARMHGYASPAELVGRAFTELRASGETGDPLGGVPDGAFETIHRRADGSTLPVLVSVTPLEDEGTTDALVITVQDVTHLKRTEERLRRAQRMEAVGRLAGGVAHEVNNMMTIVLGFSDLLARAAELPSPLRRDVEEIRKAAIRAGKISQQLLAFSRQQVLQPVNLRVNEVVEGLVPVLRLLLPANVAVDTRLSPVDAVVRVDRAQLEQVLINLAFNARDAMPTGGTITIVTEPRYLSGDAGHRLIGVPFAPGEYALLSVVDSGHGMDQATLEQIFEPFFTTKATGLGTGLGLATVYGIVKQSGGYVWAESTPGEGTTFTVGLPRRDVAAGAPSAGADQPAAGPGRGGTVLIVEDEEGVRQLAGRLLAERGYRVLEARTGEEALERITHDGTGVDLVLTDVVVPDLAGEELARRIHELQGDVPILYMSGYPREDVIARRLVSPHHPFLQKPFTADGLVDEVDRVLRACNPVVGN